MKLSILLYDYLTALDAIGPYEVLSRLPGVEVCSYFLSGRPARVGTTIRAAAAATSVPKTTASPKRWLGGNDEKAKIANPAQTTVDETRIGNPCSRRAATHVFQPMGPPAPCLRTADTR